MFGGGGGGDGSYDSDFWLWPLPPPGPLTLAIEWPSQQLELTKHEVDAALIIEAGSSSETLWPDEPTPGRSASASRFVVFSSDSSEDVETEDEERPPGD